MTMRVPVSYMSSGHVDVNYPEFDLHNVILTRANVKS